MRSVLRVLAAVVLPAAAGCATLDYYAGAVSGHLELMARARPLDEVLAEPGLDHRLRARLELAREVRAFATRVLALPDNDSYRSYADLERPFAVWNVVAAEPFSVEPRTWCFLVVGCLSYRGYFDENEARAFAAGLARQGLDVHVAGARAYSTLGWFDDPLLNTLMDLDEPRFIGVIFHELAHQRLYVEDDTAFNESYASFVEREGVRQWYRARGDEAAWRRHRRALAREASFRRLLLAARGRLAALYARDLPAGEKRRRKAGEFRRLRREYAAWKRRWDGYGGYDRWMAQPLNNAHLALVAVYNEWIPAFAALHRSSGDWEAFHRRAAALGELPPAERRARLRRLAAASPVPTPASDPL